MSATNKAINIEVLKNLVPLNNLSVDLLRQLAATARMERVSAGSAITKECEVGERALYLLSGMLVLANGNNIVDTIKAGTPQARNPLPPFQTRSATLYAKTTATILSIDRKLLDIVLSQNPAGAEGDTLDSEPDNHAWITNFLQSNALLQLPETTLQTLYSRLREIPTRAGEIVIRQGSIANSYYIIRNGRCNVVHAPSLEGPEIKIAELHTGQAFGEEALITNRTRNASVIMQEAGSLMRLEKQDFMSLLVNPLLRFASSEKTHALLASGAEIIDVRTPGNYPERDLIKNRIPLSELRTRLAQLDKNKPYVIACNDGNQSAVAAFLLNQHGYKTHVLQGGLKQFQLRPLINLDLQETVSAPAVETIEIFAPPMGGDIIDFPRPKANIKPANPPEPSKIRGMTSSAELPLLTDIVVAGAWKQRHATAVDMAPAAQQYTQADIDIAKQQAAEEARRARAAELALHLAETKAQELKAKAAAIVKVAEAEARKSAAELAQKMADEQTRTRSAFSAIVNEAKDEAKKEGQRAQTAEGAWKNAEAEILRLKADLEEIKRRNTQISAKKAMERPIAPDTVKTAALVIPKPAAAVIPERKKPIQGAKPVPPKAPALAVGQPPKPAPSDIKLGWISDSYLWETVLGYRVDPAIDSLLAPKTSQAKPQAPSATQVMPDIKPTTTTSSIATYNPATPAAAKTVKAAHSIHSSRKPASHQQKATGESEPRKSSARKYEVLLIVMVILAAVQIGGGDRLGNLYQSIHQQLGISQVTQSATHWFNNIVGNPPPEAAPTATPQELTPATTPRQQQ